MGNAPKAAQAPAAPQAIPVEAVAAKRMAVPIYLSGLGTVQAFNTVTVTARVDGSCRRWPSPKART